MVNSIKIITLNVNGLSSILKRYRLARLAREQGADIMCLQETHKSKKDKKPLFNDSAWEVLAEARSKAKARGVAVLVNRRIDFKIIETVLDKEGRFMLVKGKLENKVITIVNIYAPNKRQHKFLNKVLKKSTSSQRAKLL